MNFDINRETIIICENVYKKRLLDKFNETPILYPVSFITMSEFIKKYYFDYDYKTILYLMKKYGYKYEVAKVYLDNIYYVENKKYSSEKLNKLVKIKNELAEKELLTYDNLFKEYIKNKDIVIYKYDLNSYQKNMVSTLSNIKIIEKEYSKYPHKVLKFNTLDEEVEYISYKICELINSGVDINKIKLANVGNDYIETIDRYFKMYNIPINIDRKVSIYSTNIVKIFLNNFDANIEKAIESIEEYKDNPIYGKLVNICNKYRMQDDFNDLKDIIINDIKHTYLDDIKYKNAVEIIDYKDNEIKDEYVFLLGFNMSSIPLIYKDEDYITDNLKEELPIELTIDKNRKEKDVTIKSIDNIKNLTITYKEKDNTNVYYPSNLISLYEVEDGKIDIHKSYSSLNDKLRLTSELDNLIKYGVKSDNLNILNSNYDIPYMNYDNKFKGIDKNLLKDYLGNNLTLSYSSMDLYNKCSFRYYLSDILKLDLYEETFYTMIGTLFHHILEIGLYKDIDVYKEVKNYLKDRQLSNKEKFYVDKLTEELLFIMETIKEQMKLCKLDKVLMEDRIVINKEGNIKVTFKGFIDKVLYKEFDNKTVVALIDYKTGKSDIDLEYFPYGLHMQLPVYLYLASNSNLKNVEFAGFYLQKILLKNPKRDSKKTLEELKREHLKLEGYSTTNEENLSLFDITYKESSVIKSLRAKKDGGFDSRSKVLTDSQIKKLIELTDKRIDTVVDGIGNAKFDINPKRYDDKLLGCEYCKFKDICYKTRKDEVSIKKDTKLEFLGGEIDE
ncbi:MAG: PD-(D/E)XK nuclease family protein [Bacilli bacterium]|nr:PD-(D/E)XK nuclease family protein [Bacilli bacterium]